MQKAIFGGGCFWCTEAVFKMLRGVTKVLPGYSGGTKEDATYAKVSTGNTRHAEVTYVEYDPAQISYEQLLDIFWKNHNPTTLNRQGPDFGSQYRSAIFYHTPEQGEIAQASKERLSQSGKFRRPIVTEIVPATTFYRAEEYHQQYLQKRGMSHCDL